LKTYWNPYKRKTAVGESGPESVNLPAGAEVKPVEQVDVKKASEPAKPTRAKKARKSK